MNGFNKVSTLIVLLSAFFGLTSGGGQCCAEETSYAGCCHDACVGECNVCCGDGASAFEAALPNYRGCLGCRSALTGDWCGHRTSLAAHGITFQGDVTPPRSL